jgi:hypothetical protein
MQVESLQHVAAGDEEQEWLVRLSSFERDQ